MRLAIQYDDISKATQQLKKIARHTPVLTAARADDITGAKVFFKCENFQRVGAFKFRGAYYAINRLTNAQKEKGVVTFSSGNHAQAVALACQLLDIPATILMPTDAPTIKLSLTRGLGANVILYDRRRDHREALAQQFVDQYGLTLISPYDDPDVIAGQGTAAQELFEEVGPLDYLFAPVGGGGLLSGSGVAAAYLSPGCKVIGVEPETGNDAQQSFRKKELVRIAVPTTIADGAQTQCIGKLVLPLLLEHINDILTVSDQQLRKQMLFFAEHMKMVVEPTGCLGAAAVLNQLVDLKGARVGVIVSGGNVDIHSFCNYIQADIQPVANTLEALL